MSSPSIALPQPAPDETGPYALVGTARAKPGQAAALEQRLLALIAPTRQEPGALAYHVHRDRADPDLFVFYESWRSIDALTEHLAKPYLVAFQADLADYVDGGLDIRWLSTPSL